MIKPDAVKNRVYGEILAKILDNDIKITQMVMKKLDYRSAEFLYAAHKGKSFFNSLIEFTTSGPVILLVLEGPNVVERWRTLMGATDSRNAVGGTIRYSYGNKGGGDFIKHNAVHGSDSVERAKEEIAHFCDWYGPFIG